MTTEVQWSELQRDPRSVAEQTDQGAVRVRRRGKSPLLLIQEKEITLASEGAATAAHALRGMVKHLDERALTDALSEMFPWIDVLPAEDQRSFVTEFSRAFETSAELEQWGVLAQTTGVEGDRGGLCEPGDSSSPLQLS